MTKSLYEYCVERERPELLAQWDKERNTVTPGDVPYGSRKKVWWRCGKGHGWQAQVNSRTSGSGCPVCDGKQVLPGENDLASAFPEVAAQWHPEKNDRLTPRDVTAFSNRKVWWLCSKGHDYAATVAHKTFAGSDCPYCTGRKVLAGFNDLETKDSAIAAQWHEDLNGELTPQMVTAGSKKKVWWQCADGHVWKAVIYTRTGAKRAGCPVCAGRVKGSTPL